MALFVMADTHLSFATGKPMDIFGSRWTDHPKKIAENWKKLVSPEDTVVIPGDISWGMSLAEAEEDLRFLHLLPGRKILSKGNHDYWWQTSAKLRTFFAEKGFTSLEILYNNALSADGFRICGTRGWYSEAASPGSADYRKIVLREAGRLRRSLSCREAEGEETLAFLHFPPVFGNFVCRELVDALHEGGVRRCFYGHMHGQYGLPRHTEFEGIRFTLVSADYLSFTPYLIRQGEEEEGTL